MQAEKQFSKNAYFLGAKRKGMILQHLNRRVKIWYTRIYYKRDLNSYRNSIHAIEFVVVCCQSGDWLE